MNENKLPIHELGTLRMFTKWITKHEDGVVEWMKNVRAAYQPNRSKVQNNDRCAVILFKDMDRNGPAAIGILDVGGLTFDDIQNWYLWNHPDASSRGKQKEEENQGNGGKAYMFKLFKGPSFLLGVNNGKLNSGGFVGKNDTLERGVPRFYPISEKEIWKDSSFDMSGKDIQVTDWSSELIKYLKPFKTDLASLPKEVSTSLKNRKSFTLVQGSDPHDWDPSDIKNFVRRLTHHPQSTLSIQQVRFYVVHNGKIINNGKPLELEEIEPYPGFEGPFEYEIPDILLTPNKRQVNTKKSSSGEHPTGKVTLFTSKDNMEASYKSLRPRWVTTYKTVTIIETIGQKGIPEIAPTTPGSHFIYAEVELDALSPDSVDIGRRRPNDTPLVSAVDKFLSDKIKELATKINELQKQELSDSILDDIQKENEILNKLKNEFLPSDVGEGLGNSSGELGGKNIISSQAESRGTPHEIKVTNYTLKISRGVSVNLSSVLHPIVKDKEGKVVRSDVFWTHENTDLIKLDKKGNFTALKVGECKIFVKLVSNTKITTPPISIRVVNVKSILLSPRDLKINVGNSKEITAQVTLENGERFTDVILEWNHDSLDKNMIKISPLGCVFGNKVGKTLAAASSDSKNTVSSTNPVSIEVVPSDNTGKSGGGFPTLKITDRDVDLIDGKIRQGDPEEPALWQTTQDERRNIWWLNIRSKDAQFAYKQRESGNLQLWRVFHSKILVEMMIQAHLHYTYTKKGEEEQPARWSDHKFFFDRKYVELTQAMWDKVLSKYVNDGIK